MKDFEAKGKSIAGRKILWILIKGEKIPVHAEICWIDEDEGFDEPFTFAYFDGECYDRRVDISDVLAIVSFEEIEFI